MAGYNGDYYSIDSSDPRTLAAWLLETLPKAAPGVAGLNEARVTVYPHWTDRSPQHPDGTPDWPSERGYPEHRWTAAEIERVARVLKAIDEDREKARLVVPG